MCHLPLPSPIAFINISASGYELQNRIKSCRIKRHILVQVASTQYCSLSPVFPKELVAIMLVKIRMTWLLMAVWYLSPLSDFVVEVTVRHVNLFEEEGKCLWHCSSYCRLGWMEGGRAERKWNFHEKHPRHQEWHYGFHNIKFTLFDFLWSNCI